VTPSLNVFLAFWREYKEISNENPLTKVRDLVGDYR